MKFIDSVKITVQAGDGGPGALTFNRLPGRPNGPANGGDGGRGGDVVLRGDHRLNTLLEFRFKPLHRAAHGARGGSNRKTGKNAPALVLPVPLGTIVSAIDDEGATDRLGEIVAEGEELVVARGGRSGKGNARFISPSRPRPDFVLDPDPGQRVELGLELKLMADIGLLGMPNAGKSTLVQAVSNARPEVADYPFTTKAPSLCVARRYERDLVIADIPGLVEGASAGVGLGHQFLKHVERVSGLAHLVTLPAFTDEDPLEVMCRDFETIERELARYSPELAKRPRIAVVSQVDRPEVSECVARFKRWCAERSMQCFAISSHRREGLEPLLDALVRLVPQGPALPVVSEGAFDPLAT
ncbi:MAG: GTPase ObgE [Myxococcota bacterium]|nr:GTPase ObgE [Myxococcota bacterium]